MLDRIDKEDIRIVVGKKLRKFDLNEELQQVFQVKDIRVRKYTSDHENDIAVIILNDKVDTEKDIIPVCINRVPYNEFKYKPHSDINGKVAGFGTTENNVLSEKLLIANFNVCCDHSPCRLGIKSITDKKYITVDKFCVSVPEHNGTVLGEGDSGGGFIVQRDNRHYLYGIVSSLTGGQEMHLFTNVPYHTEWLLKNLDPSKERSEVCGDNDSDHPCFTGENNTLNRSISSDKSINTSEAVYKNCGKINKFVPWTADQKYQIEYPWNVGLYKNENGSDYRFLCGGSILNERLVITAAHCVSRGETISSNNKEFWVAVGKYRRSWSLIDPHQQTFQVEKKFFKKRDPGSNDNYEQDIAILLVKGIISLNQNVMPICLDYTYDLKPHPNLTVSGWGRKENAILSEELRDTKVVGLDLAECRAHFTNLTYLTYDKFCATSGNNTQLAVGHGGGGLVFPKINYNQEEVYFLIGIVSVELSETIFGSTNVSKHIQWIKGLMRASESELL